MTKQVKRFGGREAGPRVCRGAGRCRPHHFSLARSVHNGSVAEVLFGGDELMVQAEDRGVAVIVATGDRDLDMAICGLPQCRVLAYDVKSTDDLIALSRRYSPRVVVLSCLLQGQRSLQATIQTLIEQSVRVVFLAAHLPETDKLVKTVKRMGVQSILNNPLIVDQIGEHILLNASHSSHSAEDGLTQGHSNRVWVWSPVNAGKTFVATNLAVVLGRRLRTVLVGEFDFSRMSWVRQRNGMCVTPLAPGLEIAGLDRGVPDADGRLVIVDGGGGGGEPEGTDDLGLVLVVTDCDPEHLEESRRELERVRSANRQLVLNKVMPGSGPPPEWVERFLGLKVGVTLPETDDVFLEQREGIPAALFSKDLRPAFSQLARLVAGGCAGGCN